MYGSLWAVDAFFLTWMSWTVDAMFSHVDVMVRVAWYTLLWIMYYAGHIYAHSLGSAGIMFASLDRM